MSPTAARRPAALPLSPKAPLPLWVGLGAPEPELEPEAPGEVPVPVEVPDGAAELLVPLALALALAAAWKASKDFSAVGLTAKTIPV